MSTAGMSRASQSVPLMAPRVRIDSMRATQAPVELGQVLRQLDIGRHRDGQDVGLDIPRVAGLDVQAHAAIALVSWLGTRSGSVGSGLVWWLRVYLTPLRGGGRVAGASDL